MARKLTSGEKVQNAMELYRGPQKAPPMRIIAKQSKSVRPKQNFKASRGR